MRENIIICFFLLFQIPLFYLNTTDHFYYFKDSSILLPPTETTVDHNVNVETFQLKPNRYYILSFFYRTDVSSAEGFVTSGYNLLNVGFEPEKQWQEVNYVFKTPLTLETSGVKVGKWNLPYSVFVKNICCKEVNPVFNDDLKIVLSSGEIIDKGNYYFFMTNTDQCVNGSKNLYDYNAYFNSWRWMFFGEKYVVYKHDFNGFQAYNSKVLITMNKHVRGECIIEYSYDLENWLDLGTITNVSSNQFYLPENCHFSYIYIKIRSNNRASSFEISDYSFQANILGLDQMQEVVYGYSIYYFEKGEKDSVSMISFDSLFDYKPVIKFINQFSSYDSIKLSVNIKNNYEKFEQTFNYSNIFKNDTISHFDFKFISPGMNNFEFMIFYDDDTVYQMNTSIFVPVIYFNEYGYYLYENSDLVLWWCEPDYKIGLSKPAPNIETKKSISIFAAKNEYQAFQLVVEPIDSSINLNVDITDLISNSGDTIQKDSIFLFFVEYIQVLIPSDKGGGVGYWPDPLLPVQEGRTINCFKKTPLWISIRVPDNVHSSDYYGDILILYNNDSIKIPIQLHVWDFQLPITTHLKTSFNLDHSLIKQYHHISNDRDLDSVMNLYYKNMSEHRISPYNPLKPITYTVTGINWINGEFDSTECYKGKTCFLIQDTSIEEDIAGQNKNYLNIQKINYSLYWFVKTEKSQQQYQITIVFFDQDYKWIPNHNCLINRQGSVYWKSDSFHMDENSIPESAKYLKIFLRPVVWSSEGNAIGKIWFDEIELNEYCDTINLIENPSFEFNNESINLVLNFDGFDTSLENAVNRYNFNCFRLNLNGFINRNYSVGSNGNFENYDITTNEYQVLYSMYLDEIQKHLIDLEVVDMFYIYWFDEPESKDYQFIKTWNSFLMKSAPFIKFLLTEEPQPLLYAYVNIWCPLLSNFDQEIARVRQAAGDEVWWYICTKPKYPYCTHFIDHHGLELRIWLWQTWKYNINGINHWNINYWSSNLLDTINDKFQNPYIDPMSYMRGYNLPLGCKMYWGNGDGRFLYPPVNSFMSKNLCFEEPMSSIRWELLREGIENYEYFYLYDSLINCKRSYQPINVPPWDKSINYYDYVINNLTDYQQDPLLMDEVINFLAKEIESLNKNLPFQ